MNFMFHMTFMVLTIPQGLHTHELPPKAIPLNITEWETGVSTCELDGYRGSIGVKHKYIYLYIHAGCILLGFCHKSLRIGFPLALMHGQGM